MLKFIKSPVLVLSVFAFSTLSVQAVSKASQMAAARSQADIDAIQKAVAESSVIAADTKAIRSIEQVNYVSNKRVYEVVVSRTQNTNMQEDSDCRKYRVKDAPRKEGETTTTSVVELAEDC